MVFGAGSDFYEKDGEPEITQWGSFTYGLTTGFQNQNIAAFENRNDWLFLNSYFQFWETNDWSFLKKCMAVTKNMGRYSGSSWSWTTSGGPLWLWVFVVGTPHVQQIQKTQFTTDVSTEVLRIYTSKPIVHGRIPPVYFLDQKCPRPPFDRGYLTLILHKALVAFTVEKWPNYWEG